MGVQRWTCDFDHGMKEDAAGKYVSYDDHKAYVDAHPNCLNCMEVERLQELLKELTDNCEASLAETGISDSRKEYRKDLLKRARAFLPPASKNKPPQKGGPSCIDLLQTCPDTPVHTDLPPRDGPNITRIKALESRCAELERVLKDVRGMCDKRRAWVNSPESEVRYYDKIIKIIDKALGDGAKEDRDTYRSAWNRSDEQLAALKAELEKAKKERDGLLNGVYRGNSISYIYSKLQSYGDTIDKVNAELRGLMDGETPNWEIVRKLRIQQTSTISRLREALEFYADKDSYIGGWDSEINKDWGETARAALAQKDEAKG